jgi:hypothetical protein
MADHNAARAGALAIPAALTLALLTAACASSSSQDVPSAAPVRSVMRVAGTAPVEVHTEASVAERTFQVPVEEVWAVVPGVYERLEIPITSADPTARELGNPGYLARRVEGKRMNSYLDCGTQLGGSIANSYDVTLSVVTRVTAREGGSTSVRTVLDATAKARATSGNPVHCQSRGVLEERIGRLVAEALAGVSG